jgi:4-diphosphocytidyl-2-C-methyl-D-erythritol kinase
MIDFPPVKINLGLSVIHRRPDGYHQLESVFYPVPWCDVLEVIPSGNQDFAFSSTGLTIPGSQEKNLCYKAWAILKQDFQIPPLQAHLHKILPMGAGLGGGSSDGAAMLKLINEVALLQLEAEQLEAYAAKLGSDCPFFIKSKPSFVSGRGEVLQEINLSLAGMHILIVMPPVSVGTAEAYSWISPSEPAHRVMDIISDPPESWKGRLVNDFEKPVSDRHPVISQIRDNLYQMGAVYAAMSGSGASVFGLFRQEPDTALFSSYTHWKGIL